jgi:hypothetical protein
MKLAVFSESPVDEAAVRILADAVLGMTTEAVDITVRSRGWPSVLQTLTAVMRQLYYHTDADGLIVVADADDSIIHQESHAVSAGDAAKCRFCQISANVQETLAHLSPAAGRAPPRVAVAVPTPSIDAWLRFAQDGQCNETAWKLEMDRNVRAFTTVRRLKQEVFGGSRSLNRMVEIAQQQAMLLAPRIAELEQHFPNSFGLLAKQLATGVPGHRPLG